MLCPISKIYNLYQNKFYKLALELRKTMSQFFMAHITSVYVCSSAFANEKRFINPPPRSSPVLKLPMGGHILKMHFSRTHTPGLPAQKEQKDKRQLISLLNKQFKGNFWR